MTHWPRTCPRSPSTWLSQRTVQVQGKRTIGKIRYPWTRPMENCLSRSPLPFAKSGYGCYPADSSCADQHRRKRFSNTRLACTASRYEEHLRIAGTNSKVLAASVGGYPRSSAAHRPDTDHSSTRSGASVDRTEVRKASFSRVAITTCERESIATAIAWLPCWAQHLGM